MARSHEWRLVALDQHWNLALLKVLDVPLSYGVKAAKLKPLDDSCSIDPSDIYSDTQELLLHQNQSNNCFRILPEEPIVSLGRFPGKPYELSVSAGLFSADCSDLPCKELLTATCITWKCGDRGAIINKSGEVSGEVIGMAFDGHDHTAILPMNFIMKWLNHHNTCGELYRPWIGVEFANLYAASEWVQEVVCHRFEPIFTGAVVELINETSIARKAGLRRNDVIIGCNGKPVHGVLQLYDLLWEEPKQFKKLEVVRPLDGSRLTVSFFVEEAKPERFYRWPEEGYIHP